MHRTPLCALSALSFAFFASTACSSSSGGGQPSGNDAGTDAPSDAAVATLDVPCTDSIDAIYGDPGTLPSDKGAIIKCAVDKVWSMSDLEAAARAPDDSGAQGYRGKPFTSGARTYRILYRTERGDGSGTPGTSSALLFVPDTPRASKLPAIVASHGSRGQAAKCPPSVTDPSTKGVEFDFVHQVYPLVGLGYAVIAPDLAGYADFGAPNDPPPAYASALDEAKSTLDGARALKKAIGSMLDGDVVLVGHSQGGHTTLSATATWPTYAPDLKVVAVAVYAPLWWSQRAWGSVFLDPSSYSFDKSAGGIVSIWYHYTHAELLDGPGHGVDLFQASKRDAVKAWVDQACWDDGFGNVDSLGTSANDVFDPAYVNAIQAAALGSDCASGDTLCQKWMKRFLDDRPHLADAAAKVPILIQQGGADTTVSPDLAACGFDRLKTDGANFKVCFLPSEGHGSIVTAQADYVADWIASLALGAPAPAACAQDQTAMVGSDGKPATCNPLIPNQ